MIEVTAGNLSVGHGSRAELTAQTGPMCAPEAASLLGGFD
jgi:hypothetical protein